MTSLEALEAFDNLMRIPSLTLFDGDFADVLGIRHLSQLLTLTCKGLPLKEVPDLSNFPHLQHLELNGCAELVRVTSSKPLAALSFV